MSEFRFTVELFNNGLSDYHFAAVMVYVTKKDNNVYDVHCFSAGVWADFFILILLFLTVSVALP